MIRLTCGDNMGGPVQFNWTIVIDLSTLQDPVWCTVCKVVCKCVVWCEMMHHCHQILVYRLVWKTTQTINYLSRAVSVQCPPPDMNSSFCP